MRNELPDRVVFLSILVCSETLHRKRKTAFSRLESIVLSHFTRKVDSNCCHSVAPSANPDHLLILIRLLFSKLSTYRAMVGSRYCLAKSVPSGATTECLVEIEYEHMFLEVTKKIP